MKTTAIRVLLLISSLMGSSITVQADGDVGMAFSGTLIEAPPCTINDDKRIEVNFGDQVGINKVNGANYRQALNYQISCQSASSGNWALTLSLSGSPAPFDNQALLTNKQNLGIRVYQNDTPFTPGSTLNINLSNPPRLEAVLVKSVGAALTEGTFEAWATLRADYQ